jgi:hypothetical protein
MLLQVYRSFIIADDFVVLADSDFLRGRVVLMEPFCVMGCVVRPGTAWLGCLGFAGRPGLAQLPPLTQ